MRTLQEDIRFAFRRLRLQPGFTAVAVLTLALGLGANTAIFTLIHGVMLRSLPVTRPSELYRLGNNNDCCVNTGLPTQYSLFSFPLFQRLAAELDEFSDLAGFQANTTLTPFRQSSGDTISMPAQFVTGNYFRMLGVTPAAGRLIEPGDDVRGAPPVMVLSYRSWNERFGADPAIVGKAVTQNGIALTIVGVAAPSFYGETVRPNPAGAWLPVQQEPTLRGAEASILDRPQSNWLYAIGRIKPGANVAAIDGRATRVVQSFLTAESFLSDNDRKRIGDQRVVVTSAAGGVQLMRNNFGQSLTLLFAMSGLVLLIAAANLANLLLARADRAQSAVRAALGASTGRLVTQSLTEGIVLALIGCAGALLVSVFAARAIVGLAFPPETALPMQTTPSLPVLLFSIALAIVTGAIFAAAPALASARANPIDALRGLAREGADRSFVPRRSLLIIQVTLSLVLLAGAGLLSKSLSRLEHQTLGFDPANRMVAYIDPPKLAGEPERLAAIFDDLQRRVGQVPGVERVAYALYSPMEGNNWSSNITISGRKTDPNRPDGSSWNRVSTNFFETVGTRVLRGRVFTAADTPASQHVVVVNATFAQRYFPETSPLGARLGIGGPARANDYEIVGVVEDVKFTQATRETTLPMIFIPAFQLATATNPGERQNQARSTLMRSIIIKTGPSRDNLEPQIRRALSAVHPDLLTTRIVPMAAQIAGNFRTNRLLATLAGAYAVLALLLATLGLYGVTAYGVSRRQHEIGVRMALGADTRTIVWGVLKGALASTAIGLAVGIPIALFAGNAISSQLYGVTSRDPLVIGASAAALLVTAAVAAVWPARRAASVSPTKALRGL